MKNKVSYHECIASISELVAKDQDGNIAEKRKVQIDRHTVIYNIFDKARAYVGRVIVHKPKNAVGLAWKLQDALDIYVYPTPEAIREVVYAYIDPGRVVELALS